MPDDQGGRVTLHEAAEELGVHYMTAYRYVRTGRLDAVLEGRRWWVDRAEVAAFGNRAARREDGGADYVARLVATLLAADAPASWSVLDAALASGATTSEAHLDVLVPALVEVGDRWERGDITVADEHAASAVALRLVGQLGLLCRRRGVKRGGVLLAAVPGDLHGLPTAILTNLLEAQGFAVRDLGANPELASLRGATEHLDDLRAIGLSATTSGNDPAIRAAIEVLRPCGVPVLLGGSAIADEAAAVALGADGWAPGSGAAALFDAVAPSR